MSKELTRATFKVILPGLAGGALCGAGVGFDFVPASIGIIGAIALGLYVGFIVLRTRRRLKNAAQHSAHPGDA